jgi:molybdenum cofactor cytidylyltransferase
MHGTDEKIGIIILAAGASERLGQPKQLLLFKNQTLIRSAVETAIHSKAEKIVVVLGANFELIKNEIEDLNCIIVFNKNRKSGMSSSIKAGLEKLLETAPEISAAIISLCDQPLIESKHFDELIESFFQIEKPIVSAFYNNKFGVPALFSREFFSELLNLEGDRGARILLNNNSENIEKIEMPEAAFDIDTPEDVEKLSAFSEE